MCVALLFLKWFWARMDLISIGVCFSVRTRVEYVVCYMVFVNAVCFDAFLDALERCLS